MDLESRRTLANFDAAEGLVRQCSSAAAEAQRALRAAMDDREKANDKVVELIRAQGGCAISFLGWSYWVDHGRIVLRTPCAIVDDEPTSFDPYPDTFLLRVWDPITEQFWYLGRNGHDIETTVDSKESAYRFVTLAQAQRFRSERPRWARFEVATFRDPVGPPIDAEVEEPTAEGIVAALDPDDEQIVEAAAYQAVQKAFGEAHDLDREVS